MKVKTIMTRPAVSCAPETSVALAGQMMRQIDGGVLPVVEKGRLVGVVTDRDICLGLAERNRRPSEVTVQQVMSRGLQACGEKDEVRRALITMRAKRIRRLPVVDAQGQLRGMLSVNDVILRSEPVGNGQAVSYEETIKTLQRICEHRYPVPEPKPEDVTELARCL
jgi:CBS domain-containing protein